MMFLLNRKDDPRDNNNYGKPHVMDTETMTIRYESWDFVHKNCDKFVVNVDDVNKRYCFGQYMRANKFISFGDVDLLSDGVQRLDFTKAQSSISLNANLTVTYKEQGRKKEVCLVKIKHIRGTFVPRYVYKAGKFLVACFDCYCAKGLSYFKPINVYVVALYETGEPRAIWGGIIKKPYIADNVEFTKFQMLIGS